MFPKQALAVVDPLSVPNNRVGIHILFPEELKDAAKLVNSNGGDWGYVIIPIQAGDKNLEKWQTFMNEARNLHIVPIIRLASEGDYFNTKVWRKPTETDVLDFVNFLDSLTWPTKNRYIVVFNEPNRGDEWSGVPNPAEYARLLSYAVTTFKSKNQDFFIITAGLDNASVNGGVSINSYDFLRAMNASIPGIFYQVDAVASHSYPNPAFAKSAVVQDEMSIATFKFEKSLIQSITSKDLPVFITETGWSKEKVSDFLMETYWKLAWTSIWQDEKVVAVTPFIFKAHAGPFIPFSFINVDGTKSTPYKVIEELVKTKGEPALSDSKVLGTKLTPEEHLPSRTFEEENDSLEQKQLVDMSPPLRRMFRWLLQVDR